jgi:hypothetical protein
VAGEVPLGGITNYSKKTAENHIESRATGITIVFGSIDARRNTPYEKHGLNGYQKSL